MPNKPTVTDEHMKKYDAIMKTSTSQSDPATSLTNENQTRVSKLLAGIPKAKGIGNKIFIFTGRKKIIMDGAEREVEKIKTIDAAKQAPLTPAAPKVDIEKINSTPVKTVDAPLEVIVKKEPKKDTKEEPKKEERKTEPSKHEEKPKEVRVERIPPSPKASVAKESKPIPRPLLIVGLLIFIATWTAAWAYVFGYFKL